MKRLTKRSTFIFSAVIVGLTFIILSVFLTGLSTQDRNRHIAIDYLRQTTELQHRLQEVILEAHAFRLENYDPVVEVTNQIESICPIVESLHEAFLFSYNVKMASALHEYCVLNAKTLSAVERFKSKNSLLRNSIKYLPVVINGLKSERNKSFALKVYSDILLYCLQPTDAFRSLINEDLNRILSIKRVSPGEVSQLMALEKHARLVLDTASDRSRLEEEIYSPQLKQSIVNLTDSYLVAADKLEKWSQAFKTSAVVFSAILLFSLLYLLHRLQSSADLLSDLNLTLENKVAVRTHELKTALCDLEVQQEFIAHTAKMSALGEMAGGVAHEINTPLAAISLKAEMLLLGEQDSTTVKTLNEIISIVERVAKIVQGLRTFSRSSGSDAFRKASVKSIIDDTLILCAQKFAINNVRLDLNLTPDFEISCSPEQISQVVLNLLNNSFDAVSELNEKWVRIDAKEESGHMVLSITDSGKGISESIRNKVMQPFFTTKGVGKGMGIGLSISQGIVAKHGGELTYDASVSNTTFKLRIPLAPQQNAA